MDINTIRYWHKLEHFYPYILEEQRDKNIKTFSVKETMDFPDYNAKDIPIDMQVRYYEIYLGIFKVDSALKVLAEKMHAQKEFHDESDETSCFCKIRVEADGTFNKENFRISSFPWAIQRVKENEIDLEQWDEDFQKFQREFFLRFFNCHRVLTYEILKNILYEIKTSIDWNIEFETCWMRVDRVVGDIIGEGKAYNDSVAEVATNKKTDVEVQLENKRVDELIKANELLNSFFVRDLERVLEQINNKNYGTALEKFVVHQSKEKIEIERNKEELFKIFNPKYLPLGKWPSGYGLRAMQQVAVNLSLCDLCMDNIFSVNGPPGTGKTTLLRDIVAAKEVERAIKLLELEAPDDAFIDTIGELNDNGFKTKVRSLKHGLENYGILVASNNNSAVRNITDELPLKESISDKYVDSYSYFSEVSNRVLKNDTWGILSATLGNYDNKIKFINDFWPVFEKEKDKFKFHRYLKDLKNQRSKADCITNWKRAKKQYEEVYLQVKAVYADMQKCYDEIKESVTADILLKEVEEGRKSIAADKNQIESALETQKAQIDRNKEVLLRKENLKKEIKQNTSFFWIKYICGNSLADYKQIESDIRSIILEKNSLYEKLDKLQDMYEEKNIEAIALEKKYEKILNEQQIRKRFIEDWCVEYKTIIPDDMYLTNLTKEDGEERASAQNVSPWNGEKIIELREQLYLEAVNLHRAFVENSGYIYEQLDAFNKLIRGKIPKDQADEFATPLIQTFQLVVPVISSTFASIGTFLKYAGRNTFGLLLIDEAGQALPQSAVGAIWRAEKCVIVGDPLQIEPVVTIHDKTIQFLKMYFQQSDLIASKETSVQSLADCCNKFGGWRYYDEEMWIGSPLLVHGRCQRSIFDIANIIAYNKKMIYGTKTAACAKCEWIHVVGSAINKHYVPEQAIAISKQVINAFMDAQTEGKETPSLFIITPFRSVKAGLIHYFLNNDFLYYQIYREDDKEKKTVIRDWICKNIGTIHTFQGKEADKVIIVLGVDSGEKGYGAIQWASQKPNILNVAVTRAKKQLCIVGDKDKWAQQPYFDVAYDICVNNEMSTLKE